MEIQQNDFKLIEDDDDGVWMKFSACLAYANGIMAHNNNCSFILDLF